jgi:hypothetical protein
MVIDHTLTQLFTETRQTGVLDPGRFLNSCPPSVASKNGISSSSSSDLNIVMFECDNWVACRMSQCLRNVTRKNEYYDQKLK